MERAEAERLFLPAARDAARAFPVSDPRVSLVTVSENVTFRLTDGGTGEDWVLRLHRPGYNSAAELEAERVWTAALREAGLEAPEPLPARDGRAFVAQPIEATGETRLAGVTRWSGSGRRRRVVISTAIDRPSASRSRTRTGYTPGSSISWPHCGSGFGWPSR